MLFGNQKYETIQDTTPFQHFLIDFCLCFLTTDSSVLLSFITEALTLLNIDIGNKTIPMQVHEIREKLIDLQLSLQPKAAGPCIPEEEPVFLIRSKDPIGPDTVQQWVMMATKNAVSAERLRSAIEQLANMRAYQQSSGFSEFT